jgi:hypothetical protein
MYALRDVVMVRCLRNVILIAAIVLPGGAAFAEDRQSANYMMAGCRGILLDHVPPKLYFDTPYCAGVIDGLGWADSGICPPAGATSGQAVRVVVKYIDDRPERLHEKFYTLALEALRAAFPCKK